MTVKLPIEFRKRLLKLQGDYLLQCNNRGTDQSLRLLQNIKFNKFQFVAFPEHIKGRTLCGVTCHIIHSRRERLVYTCTCDHFQKERVRAARANKPTPLCHHLGKMSAIVLINGREYGGIND